MARYAYRCANGGHQFDLDFKMGTAPAIVSESCCGGQADRDYASDFASVKFDMGDPWRSTYLSGKNDEIAAKRGVAIDARAPQNLSDWKREKARGREYVGDDYSKLTPLGQQSIKDSKAS